MGTSRGPETKRNRGAWNQARRRRVVARPRTPRPARAAKEAGSGTAELVMVTDSMDVLANAQGIRHLANCPESSGIFAVNRTGNCRCIHAGVRLLRCDPSASDWRGSSGHGEG